MLVNEMRKKLKTVYNNYTWRRKVDLMPDRQVIAIFYSMQEKGIFAAMKKTKQDSYHQIDLQECFGIDMR